MDDTWWKMLPIPTTNGAPSSGSSFLRATSVAVQTTTHRTNQHHSLGDLPLTQSNPDIPYSRRYIMRGKCAMTNKNITSGRWASGSVVVT